MSFTSFHLRQNRSGNSALQIKDFGVWLPQRTVHISVVSCKGSVKTSITKHDVHNCILYICACLQYWQTKVGHRHPKIICHQTVRNPHFSRDKSFFFNFLLVWLKYLASFFHNMKETQRSCISSCKFRGFHFASLSPLKLCFLLVYYMDFQVQHPKITCKEKSKILNENHQKTVMRKNGNRNLHQARTKSIRI